MARHAIDADKAFEMLRDHSQHNGRKLADIATRSSRATSYCYRLIPAQHPTTAPRPTTPSTRPAG